MPTSRNRPAHKRKANHYTTTLKQQRVAQQRRELRERMDHFRTSNHLDSATEVGKGFVGGGQATADLTAFDVVPG